MRLFSLLCLGHLILMGCAQKDSESTFSPSNENVLDAVNYIEKNVAIPNGLSISRKKKEEYDRYYTLTDHFGAFEIRGVYLLNIKIKDLQEFKLHSHSGVYLVPEKYLPVVSDGGCSVISVSYKIDIQALERYKLEGLISDKTLAIQAFCNGIG